MLQDCHLLWSHFPITFANSCRILYRRPNPRPKPGLDCSAFVRHYLRNRVCFLFLQLLRCFSSLGSLLAPYAFRCRYPLPGGLPHSEILGSQLGYQLPKAYRRFLRPSSPLNAKTSTIRPFRLDPVDPIPIFQPKSVASLRRGFCEPRQLMSSSITPPGFRPL